MNNISNLPASAPSRTNTRSKLGIFILCVVIIGAMSAYFIMRKGDNDSTIKKVTVNQAAKVLLYLPLYIAQEKGFFKEEGLDVSITTGGGDSQAFAAVVGGAADFAQGDPMMVPIARQRGGPGKIIGNVVGRVAFWGVALDKGMQPIATSADFMGKRVVTYPEPMTIYALQKKNLIDAGLKIGVDSKIVQTQFGTELAPLFSGDADITMTLEPVVSEAVSKGAHIVYSFPERYGDFTLTGVMVTEDTIKKSPENVQHLLNAYQKALTYAHTDPDGAIAVAGKEFPDVDKATLANAVRRMLKEETIPKSVGVTKEAYDKAVNVRKDIGDLKNDIPYTEAVENKFAEEAAKKFGIK